MFLMKKLVVASLSAAALMTNGANALSSPVGMWLAKDGAKIRISPCGRNLCGFIAQTATRIDPATGRPITDKNNADLAKRKRPLAGVQILISLQPNGANRWLGQLYNDDDGQTYQGNLIELSPSSIRVEGCSAGICGGDNLTRLK